MKVVRPSGLQSSTLGLVLDQSLERVALPLGQLISTFGRNFNLSLEKVALPGCLQSLTFGMRAWSQMYSHTALSSMHVQKTTFRGEVLAADWWKCSGRALSRMKSHTALSSVPARRARLRLRRPCNCWRRGNGKGSLFYWVAR